MRIIFDSCSVTNLQIDLRMALQEDFLDNSDVGESLDDVESLLKKHGMFKHDAFTF